MTEQESFQYLCHMLDDQTPDNPLLSAIAPIYQLLSKEMRLLNLANRKETVMKSRGRWVSDDAFPGLKRFEYPCGTSKAMDLMYQSVAHQAAVDGLATAVLIGASNILRIVANAAMAISDLSQEVIWSCKPTFRKTTWAKAIIAGGNYVRHSSEWADAHAAGKLRKDAERNIESLCAIGFSEAKLTDGRVKFSEIVEQLKLGDWGQTHRYVSEWALTVGALVDKCNEIRQ